MAYAQAHCANGVLSLCIWRIGPDNACGPGAVAADAADLPEDEMVQDETHLVGDIHPRMSSVCTMACVPVARCYRGGRGGYYTTLPTRRLGVCLCLCCVPRADDIGEDQTTVEAAIRSIFALSFPGSIANFK